MSNTTDQQEVVSLISSLLGCDLTVKHLKPTIVFMTALLLIILGTIHADGKVSDSEKQRLKEILDTLFLQNEKLYGAALAITKRIERDKTYRSIKDTVNLANLLSENEKLLLIAFGYQLSASDGTVNIQGRKYLEVLGRQLQISSNNLKALELAFNSSSEIENDELILETKSKLDPSRFRQLGSVFVKAAVQLARYLPKDSKTRESTDSHSSLSVGFDSGLKSIKQKFNNLALIGHQLMSLAGEGVERNIFPDNFLERTQSLLKKVEQVSFRVAVVGEFSQGKSTLLNAWLGEELQPARVIPCSGTITLLKHGSRRRIICYFRDGAIEEIPFDQYKEAATIPEEAALSNRAAGLARSNIERIVVEHPDLKVCRDGIEIIDSPGLNEHPERTQIARDILQGTDAIIFLTNASRPLTEKEQELLIEFQALVNEGKIEEPARNIFVVANFFDLLRREKDRQNVRDRIHSLVAGKHPVITGKDRIHFVSAQAALDAKLENEDNQYLQDFQGFIQALENFLGNELGQLRLQKSLKSFENLLDIYTAELTQFATLLNGKIEVSEQDKASLLDLIGDAAGRDVKLQLLAKDLQEDSVEKILPVWENWLENLYERIENKSSQWSSEEIEKAKVMQDYAEFFARDLANDLSEQLGAKIADEILVENIQIFDNATNKHLEEIRAKLEKLDAQIGSKLGRQFSTSLGDFQESFDLKISTDGDDGEGGWLGWGGGLAITGLLSVLTGGLFIPIALGTAGAGLLGWLFNEDPKDKILEKGFEKFSESAQAIYENLETRVADIFVEKLDAASNAIEQSILLSEQLIAQQNLVKEENRELLVRHQDWLQVQLENLKQLKQQLKSIERSIA